MVFTAITYGVPTFNPSYGSDGKVRTVTVIQQYTAAAGAETSFYFMGGVAGDVASYARQMKGYFGDKLVKIKEIMLGTDVLAAPTSFYGTLYRSTQPTRVCAYTERLICVDNDYVVMPVCEGPYSFGWDSFITTQSMMIVTCSALTANDVCYLDIIFEVVE